MENQITLPERTLPEIKCCKLLNDKTEPGCEKKATWDAYYGPRLEDNTQGCDDHILSIIPDGIPEVTLVAII